MGQQSLWDLEQRYEILAQKQDILIRLDSIIPWQEFRPILEQIHDKPRKSNAGRKPTDVLLLFKMLILQQLYNISDESLEYQINDRLSFMRFLHLGIEERVPGCHNRVVISSAIDIAAVTSNPCSSSLIA
ncbi:hypothetical protein DO97_10875, partial [Neosynechococcus sphagnicola sy1]